MGSNVSCEQEQKRLQEQNRPQEQNRLQEQKRLRRERLRRERLQEQERLQKQERLQEQERLRSTNVTEICYDPNDTTLNFAEDDEHDFECVRYTSKRAQMSCGHTVTPMSLFNWCQRQLDEGKTKFECGCCNAVWSFEEVCKMALLTEEKKKMFDKNLFKNVFKELRAKECPGCKSHVLRSNPNNLCVQCPQCRADKRVNYEFCWQCLREWKGPARSDHCDNEGCINETLETLRTCPVIEFTDVKGVTGCPSVRACPTCGLLLAHSREACKNITCTSCKVEFCFVCLKTTVECKKTDNHKYFGACSSGVAPRQTSIPVKNK